MKTPALESSDELDEGLALYAAGRYWDAHEAWESLWRRDRAREWADCVQGLIQVAAAFHKLYVKREPASATRILARALPRLERYPASYLELELGQPFRLPQDLEPLMPAFKGLLRIDADSVEWSFAAR